MADSQKTGAGGFGGSGPSQFSSSTGFSRTAFPQTSPNIGRGGSSGDVSSSDSNDILIPQAGTPPTGSGFTANPGTSAPRTTPQGLAFSETGKAVSPNLTEFLKSLGTAAGFLTGPMGAVASLGAGLVGSSEGIQPGGPGTLPGLTDIIKSIFSGKGDKGGTGESSTSSGGGSQGDPGFSVDAPLSGGADTLGEPQGGPGTDTLDGTSGGGASLGGAAQNIADDLGGWNPEGKSASDIEAHAESQVGSYSLSDAISGGGSLGRSEGLTPGSPGAGGPTTLGGSEPMNLGTISPGGYTAPGQTTFSVDPSNLGTGGGVKGGSGDDSLLGTSVQNVASDIYGGGNNLSSESYTGGEGGGSSSGDTVICTALYRAGIISEAVWRADGDFGRSLPRAVIVGYHAWARPFSKLMERNRVAFWIGRLIGKGWANEMAYRRGVVGATPSLIGKFALSVIAPLCGMIGKAKVKFSYSGKLAPVRAGD